jgi:hypothetical protein
LVKFSIQATETPNVLGRYGAGLAVLVFGDYIITPSSEVYKSAVCKVFYKNYWGWYSGKRYRHL